MYDVISRQAVIDLLKQMRKDGGMVPWEARMYSPESGKCRPHNQTSYGAGIVSLQAETVGFV